MTPLEGFFLGVFVVLIILLPFWILSLRFYAVSDAYLALFCEQAATYPGSTPSIPGFGN